MQRLACILSVAFLASCGNTTTGLPPNAGFDLALAPGACGSDVDCSAPTPRCDRNTQTCVPCLPANDNCPRGLKCLPSGGSYACTASCVIDNDCPRSDGGSPMSC